MAALVAAMITRAADSVAAASLPIHEAEFWLRLLAAELSLEKSRVLLEEFGSLSINSVSDLLAHPSLTAGERARAQKASLAILEKSIAAGISILTAADFAGSLGELEHVPPALFVDGDASVLETPTIAIVGTRSASAYGRACAMKFAESFAHSGITVVSGGAVGIDTVAHTAALDAGGKTVAVLAGGVDQLYPAVNFGLFQRIRQSGCMVSQFALGSKPAQHEFIVRNGLIAAMSLAVLVVEAPAKSGALHTALAAAECGREVYVVPSGIDHMSFRGSHALIRDGATLVYHPDQILESLNIQPIVKKLAPEQASGIGERILAVLSTTPCPSERIVELTGLETFEVLGELTMLELEGRILRNAGGFSKRI